MQFIWNMKREKTLTVNNNHIDATPPKSQVTDMLYFVTRDSNAISDLVIF